MRALVVSALLWAVATAGCFDAVEVDGTDVMGGPAAPRDLWATELPAIALAADEMVPVPVRPGAHAWRLDADAPFHGAPFVSAGSTWSGYLLPAQMPDGECGVVAGHAWAGGAMYEGRRLDIPAGQYIVLIIDGEGDPANLRFSSGAREIQAPPGQDVSSIVHHSVTFADEPTMPALVNANLHLEAPAAASLVFAGAAVEYDVPGTSFVQAGPGDLILKAKDGACQPALEARGAVAPTPGLDETRVDLAAWRPANATLHAEYDRTVDAGTFSLALHALTFTTA